MFTVHWAVAWILATGSMGTGEIDIDTQFVLEQCQAYIAQYHDRMPDYVRGSLSEGMEIEVLAVGQCRPVASGPPA